MEHKTTCTKCGYLCAPAKTASCHGCEQLGHFQSVYRAKDRTVTAINENAVML